MKTNSKPKKIKAVFIPLPGKRPINEELYKRYSKGMSIWDVPKITDKL